MIRTAVLADVPALVAMVRRVPGCWDLRWREDALEIALSAHVAVALVWEEEGAFLGFACAHDTGFRGYLGLLAVVPEARGRGIGRALVKGIEGILGERGCQVLIADVWPESEGFYRALGWGEPLAVLLRHRTTAPEQVTLTLNVVGG